MFFLSFKKWTFTEFKQKNNRKLVAFLQKLLIGLEEGSGFVCIEESPRGTKITFRKQIIVYNDLNKLQRRQIFV